MDDLDAILIKLARAPLSENLDAMEAKVLARITAQPVAHGGMGIGVTTIAVALVMGIVGGGSANDGVAISPASALGPVSPLAPSTLLLGEP